MLNMKKLLTKILVNQLVVKEFSVTTATNSSVSPFGAYYRLDNMGLSGYTLIGALLKGTGSTNPTSVRVQNNTSAFIYSKSAGSFTLYALYQKA